MPVTFIDPLHDTRYGEFVALHPQSTVFHSPGWMLVLADSYGFEPGCVASLEGEKISGALPYLETKGIFGGRRCVSLPFSDFGGPLFGSVAEFDEALELLAARGREKRWNHIDLRGGTCLPQTAPPLDVIYTHDIDLSAEEDVLFERLRASTRRNFRKAEKTGCAISFETSTAAVRRFYELNCITRREHGLPPQPMRFFEKIRESFFFQSKGFIAEVTASGTTVASSIFLFFKNKACYKFGASLGSSSHLRPNDYMLWKSMLHCRAIGCTTLNLGRTEKHHEGLLRFKRNWNGAESEVRYFRFSFQKNRFVTQSRCSVEPLYVRVLSRMPLPVLKSIGALFCRFAG